MQSYRVVVIRENYLEHIKDCEESPLHIETNSLKNRNGIEVIKIISITITSIRYRISKSSQKIKINFQKNHLSYTNNKETGQSHRRNIINTRFNNIRTRGVVP